MGRPDIAGQLEPPFRPAFGQCDDQIGIEPVFDGADIPDYQALATSADGLLRTSPNRLH